MNINRTITTEGLNLHKPIPFIMHNEETGTFYVTNEAKEILSSFGGDLAIICVAGPYRTGKSFLLNRFLGRQKVL